METSTLRDVANRKASYQRHYGEADPRYIEAAREHTVRKLADAIALALTADPPLTDAQRTALARMILADAEDAVA